MITKPQNIKDYLEDFHKGRIKEGLSIGCALDEFLRFKKGSFNIILGHDNVGKTYWRTWYYLVLSVKHNLKWCIWTGENQAGQIVRNLIQIYTGKPFNELSIGEVYRYQQEIGQWFDFVDNSRTYKYSELLDIFQGDYNGCLIDPYTGLDRKYGHSDNYEFLNATREWVNTNQITIDVCTHPISASGRSGAVYPQGHIWAGHIRHPYKADTEGGKPFANRCDDFIVLHRLTKNPDWWMKTLVYVDKVKNTETGGKVTSFENPLSCDYNNGLGFIVEGINPLKDHYAKGDPERLQKKLEINTNFDGYTHDPNSDIPF